MTTFLNQKIHDIQPAQIITNCVYRPPFNMAYKLCSDEQSSESLPAQIRYQFGYDMTLSTPCSSTYDHRVWRTGLPVRSAVLKPHAGELVVGWVTTSESSLLYVFGFYVCFCFLFYWIRLVASFEAL